LARARLGFASGYGFGLFTATAACFRFDHFALFAAASFGLVGTAAFATG
jgi:hypothetical protein